MDKYLSFTIEDFVTEDSFISWVKGTNQSDANYWQSWLKDHPSREPEITKARQIVQSLQFKEVDSTLDKSAIWAGIENKLTTKTNAVKERPTRKLLPLAGWVTGIAACLLLFFFVQGSFGQDTVVNSQLAKVENHILPDNSRIKLNSGSSLKYNSATWTDDRAVTLEGEAFFDVEKGSSFTVETELGMVEVLGTSFNVFARENSFSVICKSGKVQVHSGSDSVVLMPGESIYYNDGITVKDEIFLDRDDWVDGIFKYKNARLSQVISELERQYGKSIRIDSNLTNEKYTGQFGTSNMNSALSEVFWTLSLKYDVQGDIITVYK